MHAALPPRQQRSGTMPVNALNGSIHGIVSHQRHYNSAQEDAQANAKEGDCINSVGARVSHVSYRGFEHKPSDELGQNHQAIA